jgi:mannose-6-phosphate isomerase
VECQYFTTNIVELVTAVERDFTNLDTFVIYICLDGKCTLSWEDQKLDIDKGDSLLVPAQLSSFTITSPNGSSAKLLEVYIK